MTNYDREVAKSTHKVEVVPVVLEKHPNADQLSIVKVYGYQVCTGTQDWLNRPAVDSLGTRLGAYIPPDSLVDVRRPEFAFLAKEAKLDGRARIKAKKLRGVVSFGLLVPAPEGAVLGEDVAARLGVEHYEPSLQGQAGEAAGLFLGGEASSPPPLPFAAPKYDVEAFRRYAQLVFRPGEPVIVTEKIHGASGRYVFADGQMYCGSRTEWKKEYPSYSHLTVEGLASKLLEGDRRRAGKLDHVPLTPSEADDRAREILDRLHARKLQKNLWWQALEATPLLRTFCEANPGVVVYGEVYGSVQDLKYGHGPGEVSFAAFDLLKDGSWVNGGEAWRLAAAEYGIPWVPFLNSIAYGGTHARYSTIDPLPYHFDELCKLAEGPSLVRNANHVREGVVVKPVEERWHKAIGRVQLKIVGAGYLERS